MLLLDTTNTYTLKLQSKKPLFDLFTQAVLVGYGNTDFKVLGFEFSTFVQLHQSLPLAFSTHLRC